MTEIRILLTCAVSALVVLQITDATCKFHTNEGGQINVTCKKEREFPRGIPPNVISIDLTNCRLSSLHRKDLQAFSQLRSFVVAGNRLQTIDNDTFADNGELTKLDLSRNGNIAPNAMTSIICNLATVNKNIRELYLAVVKISQDDLPLILGCLEKLQLSTLDLSASVKGPLKDYAFSKLTTLRVLKLGSITPVNLRALANLSLLNTLRLSSTKLTDVPDFYDRTSNDTLLPSLKALYLDSNYIERLPQKSVGLDKLEFLSLRDNLLDRVTVAETSTLSKRLTTVFLNSNRRLQLDECSFSSTLERLELRSCRVHFTRSVRHIFRNLTEVVGLSLTYNYFDDSDDVLGVLFSAMSKLRHLSLENARIRRLPVTTFHGLHNLAMLALTDNRISSLDSNVFRDLWSLQTLNLAGNRLTAVSKELVKKLPSSLKLVNFARNPFVCTCDLLPFLKLFNGGGVQFLDLATRGSYVCHSPPKMKGLNLTAFDITDADCRHLSFGVKLTIALSCTVTFVAVVLFTVYRYRWYIGYAYFILRAKRREAREASDPTPYAYDAFVIYNRSDLLWVRDELLPVLEGKAHLRLCLHDRDWLCGHDVIDNIVQSIESSRKTLLVVSNAFAASQWCHLELTLAQHRLLADERNALILVLLEPIERRNITPRLLLQMRKQTYLEWTKDQDGNKLFWKKLLRSVKKPAGSVADGSSVGRTKRLAVADEGDDALIGQENAGSDVNERALLC